MAFSAAWFLLAQEGLLATATSHPIYAMRCDLQALGVVRIIEGRG